MVPFSFESDDGIGTHWSGPGERETSGSRVEALVGASQMSLIMVSANRPERWEVKAEARRSPAERPEVLLAESEATEELEPIEGNLRSSIARVVSSSSAWGLR